MLLRVVSVFVFLATAYAASAQMQDSVHAISGIEIKADKISVFSAGLKIQKIDSTTLSIRQGASIAMLLSEQSAFTIRSYGPGGLATLSVHGTNAAQSGVFWLGINLQQPNMGQTDLSRISSFEFSDISLHSSGASSLLGSGVIGGSLHLSNTMHFSSPFKTSLLLNAGSIGNTGAAFKMSAGNNRLAYAGSISGDWNKNNFKYTDFNGNRVRLEHALVKSISSVHQIEYIISPKQRLMTGIWYQATDRLIPPTMTMTKSLQQQTDQALRSGLQWLYSAKRQSFTIRTAFIDEKEHFRDGDSLINASYHLKTLQAEFEYKRFIGKQLSLGSGISGHNTMADVSYYQGIKYQPDGSAWIALAFTNSVKGIRSALSLRQDLSKGYRIPFSPSFSFELPFSKLISGRWSISRNFRIPTMNDKYWIPGGNPDLKPEKSLNFEAGLEFKFKGSDLLSSKINIDFYSLILDNMIQWVPVTSTIWSPKNVLKVWSRGVEVSSKSDWKYYGFNGYFRFGYVYSPSTYRETAPNEIQNLNKQLIYIPLHKVQETFYIAKGTWYSLFSFCLTGKRFVQSDNTRMLPAFTTFDFYTGVILKSKKLDFRLQGAVRNVLNASYQAVLYYPEPGRSFSVSILISK